MAKAQDSSKAASKRTPRAMTPIERAARSHKRRFMRRLRVSVPDLDPITAERLTDWSIARALVDHASSNRTRVSAFNCEQRALALLEQCLAARSQSDPLSDLAAQGKAIRERREQAGS